MSKEKYRSRVHMLLLYPENEQHQKAYEKIVQSYDYASILHNKDYFTEGENQGELKKEHWHIVLRFNQAVWSTAICKDLGIEHNYIENVKRFENALQYLIHYNDTDKAQYSVDDVKGNLKQKLVESINKVEKSEGEKVVELIQFIKEYDGKLTVTEFASYCAMNGYWSEFRRSGAIFCKMIDEKNGYITLTEGKYHQIKLMAEAVHNQITFLERVSFGPILLDESLARGQWRYLTEEEQTELENHGKIVK